MPISLLLRRNAHSLLSSLGSHRLLLYSLFSTVAVTAAIASALKSYNNFYSVTVYLSKSSRSLLVLANFGILLAFLSGKVVQQIFFGPLRPNEVERLYDRLWFFVTESLLTFTIFRDEFDIPFGIMFGFLLFVKSFHWLASDRIEWMEQRPYPGPPLLFHIRMNTLFFILWVTDIIMLLVAVESTLSSGVGGMVLFASEYAILIASISNTIAKYLLTAYELRRAATMGGETAPPWEGKSMWIFYLELTTDFLKLSTYLLFFIVIVTFYGLPLSILRDIYITARSFITRLRALHRYQSATRNMDQRYPSATEEDMPATSDRTCIICREEMVLQPPGATPSDGPNVTPKKLPCGHIFHFYCLRSWLERQQSCPTCRRTVLENNLPNAGGLAAGAPGVAQAPQGDIVNQPNGAGNAAVAQPQAGENNGFGIVGRLLGAAGAPPIVPGQFAVGPNAPQLNAAQPMEVVIQYRINYGHDGQPRHANPEPGSQSQAASHPNQPLRPPPRLAGFHDPAGNYVPWGMDNRWFEPPVNNNQPATAAAGSESVSIPPSVGETAAGSSNAASSSSDPIPQSDPREAAAQAALRRFNSSSTSTITSIKPSLSSSSSAKAAIPNVNDISRLNTPKLIPLYDRNELMAVLHTGNEAAAPFPLPLQSSNPQAAPLNVLSQAQRSDHGSAFDSTTPPMSTIEQLSTLDRLTLDVVDERLQVLRDMSHSVQTCINELTRLRSTIPSNPVTSAGQEQHGSTEESPSKPQETDNFVTDGRSGVDDTHEVTAEQGPDDKDRSQERVSEASKSI